MNDHPLHIRPIKVIFDDLMNVITLYYFIEH
jgi:hypothetical protein